MSKISTGHRQSAFGIKTDGTLWGWGSGNSNVLTSANTNPASSPVQIPGTTWKTVYQYTEGIQAFRTDGTLWMWGLNEQGLLGQNNRTNADSPKQIPGTTWTGDAFTGPQFTLATKTDGTLWTWGNSPTGAVGHGDVIARSSPTQIGTDTTWDLSKIWYQNYAEADVSIAIKKI